ncbi:MAG: hypothetical protein HC898_12935 [Phycisphaerales bacterium]|nr:hypothetical protein [Phycisphaerales bacterium]
MLINESDDPQAGIALVMGLPNLLVDNLVVAPDPAGGWLTQRYDGQRFHMLGVTTVQYAHQGLFTATLADRLMGVVQVAGTVSGVMLSCANNLQSTVGSDGVSATVKVNGVTLTTTAAQLTSAAGAGFRSTAQGHGTAAVVKSDGTQNVEPGDVLTVDLVRNVSGTVSTEMAQVVVWVVIKVSQPG